MSGQEKDERNTHDNAQPDKPGVREHQDHSGQNGGDCHEKNGSFPSHGVSLCRPKIWTLPLSNTLLVSRSKPNLFTVSLLTDEP